MDDAGRYADFHALRHSFITHLGRAGVHSRTVQELARHSTPMLTQQYTHGFKGDEVAAVNALPDLSGPSRQTVQATGTDDNNADPRLARCLAQDGGQGKTNVDSHGRSQPSDAMVPAHEKPRPAGQDAAFDGENGEGGIRTRGAGNTPLNGLANRRLQHDSPSQPTDTAGTSAHPATGTTPVLAQCLAQIVENHPDLAALIDAWPTLPDPVRAGIVAMVEAAKG